MDKLIEGGLNTMAGVDKAAVAAAAWWAKLIKMQGCPVADARKFQNALAAQLRKALVKAGSNKVVVSTEKGPDETLTRVATTQKLNSALFPDGYTMYITEKLVEVVSNDCKKAIFVSK